MELVNVSRNMWWNFAAEHGDDVVEGTFLATQEEINENLIGNTAFFGNIFGDGDVEIELEESHFDVVSTEEEAGDIAEGYNPFDYIPGGEFNSFVE